MISLLQTFAARKLRELPDPAAIATTPWMTVAVLVEKKPAKRTVKGDPYSIWVVSDLGSANATNVHVHVHVLMLFAQAHAKAICHCLSDR